MTGLWQTTVSYHTLTSNYSLVHDPLALVLEIQSKNWNGEQIQEEQST